VERLQLLGLPVEMCGAGLLWSSGGPDEGCGSDARALIVWQGCESEQVWPVCAAHRSEALFILGVFGNQVLGVLETHLEAAH
jgi:hypothetical protein